MLKRSVLCLLMGYAVTSISVFAYQEIPACNGKKMTHKNQCYNGPNRCSAQNQSDCWPNESAVRYDGSEELWTNCLLPQSLNPPEPPTPTSHCVIKSLKCCKQKKCMWEPYDPPLPEPPPGTGFIYGRCIVDEDYVNGEGQLVWLYTNGATYVTCTVGGVTYEQGDEDIP